MNLKGGYILLNLCAISLTLSGEPVTITNVDVLKKLSEFQMYVGTDEFKSQPKVGLKPVLVQYRSNESKINGVILCKCGFDTNNKKLIISGTDGEKLSIQIECVFIDNPEDVKVTPYVLQSAKVTAYRGVIGDLDILGDLDIDGDLTVDGITSKGIANTGNITNIGDIGTTGKITGGEIVENMSGYSFVSSEAIENIVKEDVYVGVVKNGNKLTIVCACNFTKTGNTTGNQEFGIIVLPPTILDKLIPAQIGIYEYMDVRVIQGASAGWSTINMSVYTQKTTSSGGGVRLAIDSTGLSQMITDTKYYVRYELTFLLSENLVSQE